LLAKPDPGQRSIERNIAANVAIVIIRDAMRKIVGELTLIHIPNVRAAGPDSLQSSHLASSF
jgi:hypothetical protein